MSRIRGMSDISRVHGGSSELSPEGERRVINAIAHDVEAQIREGDTYYLISMRWWRNWSMFVNLDGPMNTDNGSLIVNQGSLRRPPRINNFDLVCGALSINPVVEIYDSLVEGTHYILVPEQIWNHLHSWYGGGPPIARKVIARGPSSTEFSVEVYPLRLLLHKVPRPDQCVVILSRKETIGDLYRKACEIFHLNMNQVLIWDYYGRRKHLLLIDFGETLDTANIQMDQDILVEVLNQIGSYRAIGFRDNGSAPNNRLSAADSSRANHSITRGSSSNGVSRNYSSVLTNFQKLSLASKEPIRAPPCIGVSKSGSCGGLVGLLNFDNSCFMNSAIQCLVHTPEFARYFLGDFHMEINWHNPMGTAGELAMEFAELLRRLWGPGSASFDPHAFKAKLARFAPQFAGNDQHDSQELLAFLLDGLHEDLNRVKQKLYIKSRDADGRPDEEVADEYWANHKARNDSIIVDVCQGQYKSTLICPVCDKTSVTFDPFMHLSLPLRFTRPRKMRITFFSCDGSFMPSTFTVTVPKVGCLQDLIRALANSCCSVQQNEKILLAKIQDHLIHKFFEDPLMPLSVIKDGDCIAAYKIPKLTNNTRYLQLIHRCKDP